MAPLFWQNPTVYAHDFDFTPFFNKASLKLMCDELDATVSGATYRSRIGGLLDSSLDVSGFWDSTPDASAVAALGVGDRVVTVCPQGAATNVSYILQADEFDYQAFEAIGSAVPFSLSMKGSNNVGAIRGQLAKAKGTVSATGALGSGLNLGAVGASQFVYVAFHVFTAGTTITLQLQSDTANNFPAPTTRATIGPLTTTGGTWMTRVAGSITDTWWRLNVSAITGTFTVAGTIGIR